MSAIAEHQQARRFELKKIFLLSINILLLGLVFSETWLINFFPRAVVFELFSSESSYAIIVGTLHGLGILTAIVLVVVACWSSAIAGVRFAFSMALFFSMGSVCLYIAWLLTDEPFCILLGLAIVNMARIAGEVSVALSLIRLDARTCLASVAGAVMISHILNGLFPLMSSTIGNALTFLLPIIYIPLAIPLVLKIFLPVRGDTRITQDVAVVEPSSFLPLPHIVFISMFVFRVAYGFAATYFSVEGIPEVALLGFIPLMLLLLYALIGRPEKFSNTTVLASALCIIFGLLLVLNADFSGQIANSLLVIGSDLFRVLAFFVLSRVGAVNPRGAMRTLAWGVLLINAGSVLGFAAGMLARGLMDTCPTASSVIVLFLTGMFITFCLIGFNSVNFDAVLNKLVDVPDVTCAEPELPEDVSNFENTCRALAGRYALTPRETEVLLYLARGCSVREIQDEFTISYNTVKTHVHHIYMKFDVHSQSELKRMVESLRQETENSDAREV